MECKTADGVHRGDCVHWYICIQLTVYRYFEIKPGSSLASSSVSVVSLRKSLFENRQSVCNDAQRTVQA